MAGIEPASERIDHRKSTSVDGWKCRRRQPGRQNSPATIHSSPKALFRTVSDVAVRHSAILTPTRSPGGERERWTPPHEEADRLLSTAD
jgi:hypothetical protein